MIEARKGFRSVREGQNTISKALTAHRSPVITLLSEANYVISHSDG